MTKCMPSSEMVQIVISRRDIIALDKFVQFVKFKNLYVK